GGMISMTLITDIFVLKGSSSAYVVWPSILAVLAITMFGCGLINATVERIAYRPLRNAPRLAPLITAIAASFILQNIAIASKGPNYVTLNSGPSGAADFLPQGRVFSVSGITYHWAELIVVLITAPVLVALLWLVQRTKQGKAMRATA